MSEDLDANLAFFAGADPTPVSECPLIVQIALEWPDDWPFTAYFILAIILFVMFSFGVATLYLAHSYAQSGRQVPVYELAEPSPSLGEELENWLKPIAATCGLGFLAYLKIFQRHLA